MSRLLATQRLVALALVEATDGQRTVITPLPVAWSVIRAIVGVLALWWLVRRGVFAALDSAAGWLIGWRVRWQMTIIVLMAVIYEIGNQSIQSIRA